MTNDTTTFCPYCERKLGPGPITNDMHEDGCEAVEFPTIDFDAVVAAVRAKGFYAKVEHTGGNCATIFANDVDEEGAYLVAAGPGTAPDNWADPMGLVGAVGDTAEFCVGLATSEEAEYLTTADPDEIAAVICRYITAPQCQWCVGTGCQSCGFTGLGDTHEEGCDCITCAAA